MASPSHTVEHPAEFGRSIGIDLELPIGPDRRQPRGRRRYLEFAGVEVVARADLHRSHRRGAAGEHENSNRGSRPTTMSPFGVMRTVWRPHPEPFLNGA